MRLIITARAEADLEAIFDYISQDSTSNAASFVRQLREKIERISRAPRIYSLRNAIAPGLRAAAHGNYLVFFRLEDGSIEVTRVIHGARNLDELIKD